VTRSTIDGNVYGPTSVTNGSGSALVTVSGSMITNNIYAWYQISAGSVVNSFGNNDMSNNTTFVGNLSPVILQ
jgi:hypothetical protein